MDQRVWGGNTVWVAQQREEMIGFTTDHDREVRQRLRGRREGGKPGGRDGGRKQVAGVRIS